VRTVPSEDITDDGRTASWEKIDILDITPVWDAIDEEIDRRCKIDDAKRRKAATDPKAR
jgi:hypothetical protein